MRERNGGGNVDSVVDTRASYEGITEKKEMDQGMT